MLGLRLKAFALEAVALIGTTLGGVLLSKDFSNLVTGHFGETVTTSLILLVVTGLVKHLRNIHVIGKVGGGKNVQLL